jgi:putative ATPase
MHLRNPVTPLMKSQGYGEGCRYAHDAPDAFVAARNLPAEFGEAEFYQPTQHGTEVAIAERLAAWWSRRARESDPED